MIAPVPCFRATFRGAEGVFFPRTGLWIGNDGSHEHFENGDGRTGLIVSSEAVYVSPEAEPLGERVERMIRGER